MKSLIGNKWCDSSDNKVIEVYNPATNELIDTVPSLTKEDVERGIDYANEHQKDWEKK